MVEWYKLARQEWTDLAGSKLLYRDFGLKWGCTVGDRRRPVTSALAGAWREAARRADDAARLKRQADKGALGKPQLQALAAHGREIAALARKLPQGVPTELSDQLDTWAERFGRARHSDDKRSAQSLASLADIKAKKLKAQACSDKM